MAQRIGVLGGTFNPVHFGHLRVAEEAAEDLGLDLCLFMPAAVPPHKGGNRLAPFEDRLAMLQLATQSNDRLRPSDLEKTYSGKSYSVITLETLTRTYPNGTDLFFLVGLDAFLELDTWKDYTRLFELARITVLRRPGYREQQIRKFLHDEISTEFRWKEEEQKFEHPSLFPVHYLNVTSLAISSTAIRSKVAEGKSIRYLVPEEVMDYLNQKKLYRERAEKS